MSNSSRGFATIAVLIVVLALFAGTVGYAVWKSQTALTPSTNTMQIAQTTINGVSFTLPNGYVLQEPTPPTDITKRALMVKSEYIEYMKTHPNIDGPASIMIDFYPNPSNKTPNQWAETIGTGLGYQLGTSMKYSIAGKQAIRFHPPADWGAEQDFVVVQYKSWIILFSNFPQSSTDQQSLDFESLLKTVTFNDQTSGESNTSTTLNSTGTNSLKVGQTLYDRTDELQYDSLSLDRIQNGIAYMTYHSEGIDCGLHCWTPMPMMYSTTTLALKVNEFKCARADYDAKVTLTSLSSGSAVVTLGPTHSGADCPPNDSTVTVRRGELTDFPNMKKYYDNDFGFWYPNGWVVESVSGNSVPGLIVGSTLIKTISVKSNTSSYPIFISEINSPPHSIRGYGTLRSVIYSFDATNHMWMAADDDNNGHISAVHAADVSVNNIGGLHILSVPTALTNIIPLSADHFLLISSNGTEVIPFVKTIDSSDSRVATPVSLAEQIKTIQAEAEAYK